MMTPEAGPAVRLRAVEKSDLPTLFRQQSDPASHRMAGFTPRDEPAFMAHWLKIIADPETTPRAIVVDEAIAGHVVCWRKDRVWEVGYWVDRELWGRGIASAALQAFLLVARPRPLHAVVSSTNLGSMRVLEKCGFVPWKPPSESADASGTVPVAENDRRFVLNS